LHPLVRSGLDDSENMKEEKYKRNRSEFDVIHIISFSLQKRKGKRREDAD